MIEYERQEFGEEGKARPVKVITDDSVAEMVQLEEMIAECEFEDIELPKDRGEDGKFSFIIPGDLVGPFSECVWDIDDGKLERLCETWNAQAIEEALGDE